MPILFAKRFPNKTVRGLQGMKIKFDADGKAVVSEEVAKYFCAIPGYEQLPEPKAPAAPEVKPEAPVATEEPPAAPEVKPEAPAATEEPPAAPEVKPEDPAATEEPPVAPAATEDVAPDLPQVNSIEEFRALHWKTQCSLINAGKISPQTLEFIMSQSNFSKQVKAAAKLKLEEMGD